MSDEIVRTWLEHLLARGYNAAVVAEAWARPTNSLPLEPRVRPPGVALRAVVDGGLRVCTDAVESDRGPPSRHWAGYL